jgi:hypothetical protein
LSFGGPAGQIAVMHRIIVDEKKWVGESRFLHALFPEPGTMTRSIQRLRPSIICAHMKGIVCISAPSSWPERATCGAVPTISIKAHSS